MKSFFTLPWLIAFLFYWGNSAISQYYPPVRTMDVPAATDTIYIDGYPEDSYSDYGTFTIAKREGAPTENYEEPDDTDLNARFKLCWSEAYLFFYIEVTDDIKEYYTAGKEEAWTWDNVELFLDIDTNSTMAAYTETSTVQLRLTPGLKDEFGNDSVVESGGRCYGFGQDCDFVSWINAERPDGYTIELAIPWDVVNSEEDVNILPYSVENGGTVIGFDVSVTDADGDGNGIAGSRNQEGGAMMFWDLDTSDPLDGMEDNAYQDRRVFGHIALTGIPVEQPMPALNAPTEPYIAPVNKLYVPPRTDEKFLIDGKADEDSWSHAHALQLFDSDSWHGESDLSAWFKTAWDTNYLYLFADITDDYTHNLPEGSSQSWLFDCMDVYIDLDTIHADSSYGEDAIDIRFNRGVDTVLFPGRSSVEKFYQYQYDKPGMQGWVIEAAIPWEAVLPDGSSPDDLFNYIDEDIGFDIIVTDSDNSDGNINTGNAESRLTWDTDTYDENQTAWDAWHSTFLFGIAAITGSPLTSPAPEIQIYSGYLEPVEEITIPLKYGEFSEDGADDEPFWGPVNSMQLFSDIHWDGNDDLSGFFRTAWDSTFLYLYAKIDDADRFTITDKIEGPYDKLTVVLDLDTSSVNMSFDESTTVALEFARGAIDVINTGRAESPDFLYFSDELVDEAGWVVEVAIPWKAALAENAPAESFYQYLPFIGFDIMAMDRDAYYLKEVTALSRLAWDEDADVLMGYFGEELADEYTGALGIATLSEEPDAIKKLTADEINLYPNPAESAIFIESTVQLSNYKIIDMSGRVYSTGQMDGSKAKIDIYNLPQGLYLLELHTLDKSVLMKKFTVK